MLLTEESHRRSKAKRYLGRAMESASSVEFSSIVFWLLVLLLALVVVIGFVDPNFFG